MILVDGFFHADPHPGNVIYLPGNRLAMIDFGMVGTALADAPQPGDRSALRASRAATSEPMIDVLLDWAGDAAVDEPSGSPAMSTNSWPSTRACR